MAGKRTDRRESFQSLWPWPGNLFLILFGGWAFYMGYVAETEDLQLAFYGLTGVTGVVLLLGLRTIGRRPVSEPKRPARAGESHEVSFTPKSDRMPQSPSMRAEAPPIPQPRQAPALPDTRGAGPGIEALINREKAARGAQIAKLEATINERLKGIEARLGVPGEGTDGTATPAPALDEYLRIDTFNGAIHERLLPRIKDMIRTAIEERMSVHTSAGGGASPELTEELAKLRAARDVDHREIEELRTILDQARKAEGGGPALDSAALTARIDGMEKALAERGQAIDQLSAGLRQTSSDVSQLVRQMEKLGGEIAARLDGAAAATTERTPADVADLRHALETIIAQTKDIKAQQDKLTARFDSPNTGAAG